MSKLPVARIGKPVREADPGEFEVIDPKESTQRFGEFVSFRYSYTEVSAFGGRARVKSRSTSLEDGKLVSESFQADLNSDAYEAMVGQAHRLFQTQMRQLLQPFSWLLRPGKRNR